MRTGRKLSMTHKHPGLKLEGAGATLFKTYSFVFLLGGQRVYQSRLSMPVELMLDMCLACHCTCNHPKRSNSIKSQLDLPKHPVQSALLAHCQ